MSWVQLKNDLLTFAAAHPQINSVGFGDPLSIGTDNTINLRTTDRDRVVYPLLFADLQSMTANVGALTLGVSVLVMDRVEDSRNLSTVVTGSVVARWTDNEDEVLNDTLYIMRDFISKFTNDPAKDYTLQDAVSATRFVEARDDKVAGWQASANFDFEFLRSSELSGI
jgi:hypothetical protein